MSLKAHVSCAGIVREGHGIHPGGASPASSRAFASGCEAAFSLIVKPIAAAANCGVWDPTMPPLWIVLKPLAGDVIAGS